jgi:hypothetical protein
MDLDMQQREYAKTTTKDDMITYDTRLDTYFFFLPFLLLLLRMLWIY